MLGKLVLGKLVVGEIAVGEVVTGEIVLGKLRWVNDLTPPVSILNSYNKALRSYLHISLYIGCLPNNT